MADLHAVLTARIDEVGASVRAYQRGLDVGATVLIQHPEAILRGVAEDRDILRRRPPVDERPYRKLKCRHDRQAGVSHVVDWPCNKIRSLARRLNVEVPDHG